MIFDVLSTTIMTTGFLVAFSHAVLPTHWLPFVLACHGQKWSMVKTLTVTGFAGLAHALFTAVLGILVVFIGIKAESWNEHVFHVGAGLILIAFGSYYICQHIQGRHVCCGHTHGHDHPHDLVKLTSPRTDKAVIIGLLTMLALSPCEGFLPVYLSGIHYGWSGFIVLTIILAAATMSGMVFFTWIALMGWERLRLHALEKYESLVLGILLCLLGIIVMTLGH